MLAKITSSYFCLCCLVFTLLEMAGVITGWQQLNHHPPMKKMLLFVDCGENNDTYPHMQNVQWEGGRTTRVWPIYARDTEQCTAYQPSEHTITAEEQERADPPGTAAFWDKRPTQSESLHGGWNRRCGVSPSTQFEITLGVLVCYCNTSSFTAATSHLYFFYSATFIWQLVT